MEVEDENDDEVEDDWGRKEPSRNPVKEMLARDVATLTPIDRSL
jgi:hypothetical protein